MTKMYFNKARWRLTIFAIALVLFSFSASITSAFAEDKISPEDVMVTFLKAFVDYDYDTCRALLAEGSTITIIRRDGADDYSHSIQSAAEWLNGISESGVKSLDEFSVDIHQLVSLEHQHGTTVTVKFSAKGKAAAFDFTSTGFDTGNVIHTSQGWRILHYSSFENFETQEVP